MTPTPIPTTRIPSVPALAAIATSLLTLAACSSDGTADETSEPAPSDEAGALDGVLTAVVTDAHGGRACFDGTVDEITDLEALVADAWGDGALGLHRGHAQVENVSKPFSASTTTACTT